jgi:hypothetical protein
MRFLCFAFLLAILALDPASAQQATCINSGAGGTISVWTPWECVLEVTDSAANLAGRNGYLTRLKVEFSSPGAITRTGYAAWDGEVSPGKHRFVIRHLFEPTGMAIRTWTWTTTCETASSCGVGKINPSLTTSGQQRVVSGYTVINPLQRKGILKTERYLLPDNGSWGHLRQWNASEVFTWVGDSAWAAPMKATDAEWLTYVTDRSSRQVSVIHIGPAPAWAGATDRTGRAPFIRLPKCTPTGAIAPTSCDVPNVDFWRSFEGKIATANHYGLYIFLAGLMEPRSDHPSPNGPHNYPKAADALSFAHWLAARLSNRFVVFSPGFDSIKIVKDGQYLQSVIGQEIKRVNPQHLVTNHWATIGLTDIEGLHDESWLDFEMFQSGHTNGDLSQLTQRAREMAWKISGASTPPETTFAQNIKAAINGEAIYDQGGLPTADFSNYRARQAGYLSWLSGAAGYTFGVGGIWDWGIFSASMPVGWRNFSSAMAQDSAQSMRYLAQIMRTNNGQFLDARDHGKILGQPVDQSKKMVLSRNANSILAYMPHNPDIKIQYTSSAYTTITPCTALLFNPTTGQSAPICPSPATCDVNGNCSNSKITCTVEAGTCTWSNPSYQLNNAPSSDRVLQLNATLPRIWEGDAQRRLQIFAGKLSEDAPWGINGWLLDNQNTPIGNPLPLVSIPGIEGRSPAVAHDGNGDFLVVWQSLQVEGGQNLGIFGQRVMASGGLRSGPFPIVQAIDREVATPAVALDAAGDAVVVWQSIDPASGNGEIRARTVSRTNELGEVTVVAASAQISCSQPKAVMSPSGSLSVAWVELDNQLEKQEIQLRHFGEAKLQDFPEPVRVSSVDGSMFSLINLHLDESGKLEVEYEALFGQQRRGTYLQALVEGSKVGAEILLAPAFVSPEEIE